MSGATDTDPVRKIPPRTRIYFSLALEQQPYTTPACLRTNRDVRRLSCSGGKIMSSDCTAKLAIAEDSSPVFLPILLGYLRAGARDWH